MRPHSTAQLFLTGAFCAWAAQPLGANESALALLPVGVARAAQLVPDPSIGGFNLIMCPFGPNGADNCALSGSGCVTFFIPVGWGGCSVYAGGFEQMVGTFNAAPTTTLWLSAFYPASGCQSLYYESIQVPGPDICRTVQFYSSFWNVQWTAVQSGAGRTGAAATATLLAILAVLLQLSDAL